MRGGMTPSVAAVTGTANSSERMRRPSLGSRRMSARLRPWVRYVPFLYPLVLIVEGSFCSHGCSHLITLPACEIACFILRLLLLLQIQVLLLPVLESKMVLTSPTMATLPLSQTSVVTSNMTLMEFSLQALLVRHEAYMADAEKERKRLVSDVDQLEEEKRDLEVQNAQKIRENRELLEQLEGLNDALAESDAHVKNLTAALHSAHEELSRLTTLADRTESLERQLVQIEKEQIQLQEELAAKVVDEKSAVLRWRQAERTIANLQHQMDQIEREGKEERARHMEVIGRMERRREVEKELQNAAGRLKGAAAAKTGPNQGGNVVSHFVKDILQDNATLQMGIVELREMLMNSNEEVERLRQQLVLHQPVDDQAESNAPTPTLQKELHVSPEVQKQDVELHVHHHYYGAEKQQTKNQGKSRARKKRHVVGPSPFTPPRGHTPRSSISRANPMSSPLAPPASAILAQTAVTIPQNNRWSLQSCQTAVSYDTSSAPGSPCARSHRTSSIFDRVFSDAAYDDSSRPTSPESMASPPFTPLKDLPDIGGSCPEESYLSASPSVEVARKGHKKRSSNGSRSFSSPISLLGKSGAAMTKSSPLSPLRPVTTQSEASFDDPHPTIPEEPEAESGLSDNQTTPALSATTVSPSEDDTPSALSSPFFQPRLRRAGSHESLLSISGMDIHTSSNQYHAYMSSLSPLSSTHRSTQPVLSSDTATATRASLANHPGLESSRALSYSLLRGSPSSARVPSQKNSTPGTEDKKEAQPLTQKLGGWVFGRWGVTPAPSTPPAKKVREFRPAGINQPGPIFGLGPEERSKIPFQLTVEQLDEDALGDALGEG